MSQVQQILFQDSMDPSRFLRIVEEKQDTVVCKVWFGPNRDQLVFHGSVELPKKIFFPTGGGRIGFNPALTVQQELIKRQPRERRREREEYDD